MSAPGGAMDAYAYGTSWNRLSERTSLTVICGA
jgi:hypothetical protein